MSLTQGTRKLLIKELKVPLFEKLKGLSIKKLKSFLVKD